MAKLLSKVALSSLSILQVLLAASSSHSWSLPIVLFLALFLCQFPITMAISWKLALHLALLHDSSRAHVCPVRLTLKGEVSTVNCGGKSIVSPSFKGGREW